MEELIKGDCLEYMATMADNSVDLIVTDPPYLMDYKTGRRNGKSDPFQVERTNNETHKFATVIAGDNDPDLISNYIAECWRIMKDDTAMYIFCNSNKVAFFVNELEKYFTMRNIIVWVKNNHTAGDLEHAFGKKHEFIILVNKGNAKIQGKRIQDVWEYDKVVGKGQLHQNQKPVPLLKQCILKHSKEGDVVFDGFGGSGSTAVAARELKRGFIVIEKDEEYFAVAKKRLAEEKGLLDF
jgi:site-specific DNA-methyltransferase (adenine-specific)